MLRGTLEHPKFVDLVGRLDVPRCMAAGVLESLWHFTARYAPDGAVGKWGDSAIARAIDWPGDAGVLIAALVGAGWLDEREDCRLYVHDWHDHADDAVQRQLARKIAHFANGAQPRTSRLATHERVKVESEYAQRAPNVRAHSAPTVRTPGAQSAPLRGPSPPRPAPPGPLPSGAQENQSAAHRGSAASSNGAAPRKQRPKKPREPKPSHHAIRIYCEEYKTAREQSGVVPPKDQKNLGQVYVDLGEDQMRAALRVFFELKEQWIRETSYSAGAFLGALPRCHARAQGIAASEERKRAREREDAERLAREGGSWDDIPAETQRKAASLFGGTK